ncbi:RadC family protein [Frateuria aurantia]
MSIKHWPASERPREKLLQQGSQRLSDAELLALVFGSGSRGKDAISLGRELLRNAGGLRALLASRPSWPAVTGLGPAKQARLLACLELARRALGEELQQRTALTNPTDSGQFLRARLGDLPYEVFACLYLDNRHRVLAFEELFRGTIDGASVYPREVVRACLGHNANAVIFAHNHPSGHAEPSEADRHVTARLKQALDLVGVRVLDHLIIGDGTPTSMASLGLL